MKSYRAKPYASNPRIARLQCRVKWFFWRTIATGSTPTMQRYAAEMEQRHTWEKIIGNTLAKRFARNNHP